MDKFLMPLDISRLYEMFAQVEDITARNSFAILASVVEEGKRLFNKTHAQK